MPHLSEMFKGTITTALATDAALVAATSPTVKQQIGTTQRVSVNAMGFPHITTGERITAKQVYALSDSLKMRWINANRIFTKVIAYERTRNPFDKKFVEKTVSKEQSDGSHAKLCISSCLIHERGPLPTRNALVEVDIAYSNLFEQAGVKGAVNN